MDYLSKLSVAFQGSAEEKACSSVLFNDTPVEMGDARLNNIAALTFNTGTCEKIFGVLNKAILMQENPWNTLLKTVYLLHTIVLYGSELSIDKAIKLCPYVHDLMNYNSALVGKSMFKGGVDYGEPVREAAKVLYGVLSSDGYIREARNNARQGGSWAIPVGTSANNSTPNQANFVFGQGVAATQTTGMGAGFDLQAVPGMYENRPERYFDKDDDMRRQAVMTGDHQFTREVTINTK